MINYQTANKKELKAFVKTIRNTFPSNIYINLSIDSEEKLREYIAAYYEWQERANERETQERKINEKIKMEEELEENQRLEKIKIALNEIVSYQDKPIAMSIIGKKIADLINLYPNFETNTWSKNGEMRIYVNDLSMTRRNRGFMIIKDKINFSNLNCNFEHEGVLRSLVFSNLENDLIKTTKLRTPDEIQEAIKFGENVADLEIESALDRIYGKGKWDRWDREDFEG